MINVLIPYDKDFEKYSKECKTLYETLQNDIGDDNSFEFITQNTFFYLFENNGELIGAIYFFIDEAGKLFLNAFAKRKKHTLCLECLRISLNWFNPPIYAQAQNRASALCLLKCGFRRLKENIFIYT